MCNGDRGYNHRVLSIAFLREEILALIQLLKMSMFFSLQGAKQCSFGPLIPFCADKPKSQFSIVVRERVFGP